MIEKATTTPTAESFAVDEIIDRYGAEPSFLIQVLLDIQMENHWLPEPALDRVHERLGVPRARIQQRRALTAWLERVDDVTRPAKADPVDLA